VYDPALSVVMDEGSDFGRCETGTFVYTAGPSGRSIVPELTATVLPVGDTARPRAGSGTANAVGTGADARWEWAMPELATTSAANVLDLALRGEDYPNGTVLTPQIAYTDLVAGPVSSAGPGSVTVLPDTKFEVTLVDVATNTEIDRFVTGETTEVGINVRNAGTAACNDVAGVDLSTEVDATAFVAQLIGDLASGASAEPSAAFTAPASPGEVEFVTTLDVAGLTEPLVFRRQVPVIQGDTTSSTSSTTSTSSSTTSTSSSTTSTSSSTTSSSTTSTTSTLPTSSSSSTTSTSTTSSTTTTTAVPPGTPPPTSGGTGGPLIAVPPTIERTTDPGAPYATVEFTVTATATATATASALQEPDAGTAALVATIPVDCVPASGSRFPIGSNTVTCTATDVAGRSSVASFLVNVTDTEPPRISVPDGPITVVVGSNGPGAYVPPSVLDNSGGGSMTCTPGPETIFEVGTTTVSCTATDASGNVETVSFAVVVKPPLATELPATGGGTAPIRLALLVLTSGMVLVVIATARRRGPGRLTPRP
jgi:hypothetical protein